jgi:hypothetical protein
VFCSSFSVRRHLGGHRAAQRRCAREGISHWHSQLVLPQLVPYKHERVFLGKFVDIDNVIERHFYVIRIVKYPFSKPTLSLFTFALRAAYTVSDACA